MPFPSAATARRAAPPPNPSPDARAAAIDLGRAVSRRPLLRLAPGVAPALAFLHLRPEPGVPGAAPGDDLARHASEGVALRLLAALADPAQADALLGPAPGLLIDLPIRAILPQPAFTAASVAALPLAAAADPAAFASLAEAARRRGWGVALRGLGAGTLDRVRPRVVVADWFIVEWSAALGDGPTPDGLRQLDPPRIILIGCDTAAALDWGLDLDIRIFGGARIDAAPSASGRGS
ncbi:hypothetical protein [Plastoroseomonas arctica]|uniref:EAL domain-containing protein n=1 Tax=Plastoroseomonas arctica TaxID=1509237 RepID=A0AAF1JZQ6_9PROT|nr:hypothetical protein [Plastoroseomonas arctica]MBR0657040.1 hypothetical protein [Plastoroseomonas arctica]